MTPLPGCRWRPFTSTSACPTFSTASANWLESVPSTSVLFAWSMSLLSSIMCEPPNEVYKQYNRRATTPTSPVRPAPYLVKLPGKRADVDSKHPTPDPPARGRGEVRVENKHIAAQPRCVCSQIKKAASHFGEGIGWVLSYLTGLCHK